MKITGEVKMKGQIFSFTRISSFLSIIFIIGALFLGSCTDINEFTIGQDFVEPQTRLQVVDTFKVDLSTILIDSIATSGTGTALVGSYADTIMGSVKCNAYFDLAYPGLSGVNVEDDFIFDSAAFVFRSTGYSYGDTTTLMRIGIHQLTEKIVPFTSAGSSTPLLYNATSFDFSPDPLAVKEFYPRPNSIDTVFSINVNEFGENLYELFRNKDELVSDQASFDDYLKGFVLTTSNNENNSVIGLTGDKENISLVLYYHVDQEFPEEKSFTFTMGESNHQFNSIRTDFTNSPLKDLNRENNQLLSSVTGDISVLQGSTGLMARVGFPTVQDILMNQRWKVLRAELVFEPQRTSYDYFTLPEKLNFYETDKENRFNSNSLMIDSDRNPRLPEFTYDEFFNEDTRYTFDITSFIIGELSDYYFDYYHGILIGIEQSDLLASLERLIIDGRHPPVKLRIYYLTY